MCYRLWGSTGEPRMQPIVLISPWCPLKHVVSQCNGCCRWKGGGQRTRAARASVQTEAPQTFVWPQLGGAVSTRRRKTNTEQAGFKGRVQESRTRRCAMCMNGTLQTCCGTKAILIPLTRHHGWGAGRDMTGNKSTAFVFQFWGGGGGLGCFLVMHVREK